MHGIHSQDILENWTAFIHRACLKIEGHFVKIGRHSFSGYTGKLHSIHSRGKLENWTAFTLGAYRKIGQHSL
jgi:hypothetical protein